MGEEVHQVVNYSTIEHVHVPSKHIAGLSQQCYSAPNCVAGTEIAAGSSTPNDSCAGTNEGQSYADSGGSCVVGQCIGE